MNDNISKEQDIEQIMSRLYKRDNMPVDKNVNLEDSLYEGLKELENVYHATLSDLVNVCIEYYVLKDEIKYYPKPENEIAIYRNLRIRQKNIQDLQEINKRTGISVTRLVNLAIKKVLEIYNKH